MRHNNISIFVPHVGCPYKCVFCDQRAISSVHSLPDKHYVKNICLHAMDSIPKEQWSQTEIAFFGGSFTAMDRTYMENLLKAASIFVGKEGFAGIRISTRPDCIDRSVLDILKKYGVTSIELGAQSMNDNVLYLNGRGHTAKAVTDACELIHTYNFSLGLQIMVGMYGDSTEGLYKTAEKIIALKPDTVRIYPVVVLKNTRLEQLYRTGLYQPIALDSAVSICTDLLEIFESHGIKVIRLGLHSEAEMQENMVAGIYHPAFRELCESKRMLNRVLLKLKNITGNQILIEVHPTNISKMIGQKRCNINKLDDLGYKVKVQGNQSLELNGIKVKDVSNCC